MVYKCHDYNDNLGRRAREAASSVGGNLRIRGGEALHCYYRCQLSSELTGQYHLKLAGKQKNLANKKHRHPWGV